MPRATAGTGGACRATLRSRSTGRSWMPRRRATLSTSGPLSRPPTWPKVRTQHLQTRLTRPPGKAHTSPTYTVYLEGIWVQRERDRAERSISDDEIAALLQSIPPKDMLPVLVASFCPQIYGQALVKLGILLTLFGSSSATRSGGAAAVRVRADPHMLLVGDPGLGKSQLITAAAAIAPRGIYVCGNTSTASGLTATLHHESSSNSTGGSSYALEAGALVLADTGVCCIDEFDKIGDQQRVLLEVMEQQMVHVAKAGIVCSLPARASILAAANPMGGHYKYPAAVHPCGSCLLAAPRGCWRT